MGGGSKPGAATAFSAPGPLQRPIMEAMANLGVILKTAGSVIAATTAVLAALKENPQLADSATKALDKVKSAANSQNPRRRFDAKLSAIEACADAVAVQFGQQSEAEQWRTEAATLRMRAELAWTGHTGKQRRRRMKALNEETAEVLDRINHRLVEVASAPPQPTPAELTE